MPVVMGARKARKAPAANAAGDYAWYGTVGGASTGDIEFRLLRCLMRPARGDTLLDIGGGAGCFTRRFAGDVERQSRPIM